MSVKPTITDRGWTIPGSGRTIRIAEANQGMMLFPLDQDIQEGVCGDPMLCALSQSAMRMMGASAAWVGNTIAYFVVKIEGEPFALRFEIAPNTRRAIEEFDATGKMPVEGFAFIPVRQSDRLAAKRDKNLRTRGKGTPGTARPKTYGVRRGRSGKTPVCTLEWREADDLKEVGGEEK